MELVDSHCHPDDAQFDGDRAAMLERARAGGLKYLLAIGTGNGPPDLEAALRLASEYPFIWATVGIHPNDAAKVESNNFAVLAGLLRHPKVVALGEIGLDYHWGVSKEAQAPLFVRQMELAAAAAKPIIVHTRDAWGDTMDLLRKHWARTGLPCVMHCFTGTPEQAAECLALDFHLAFGGVTTFPKAAEVRAAARMVPEDRLLLETDAPYLAPVPQRGKRNEPAFVAHTAKVVAEVRGVSVETLAAQTTANFERLFSLNQSLHCELVTRETDAK